MRGRLAAASMAVLAAAGCAAGGTATGGRAAGKPAVTAGTSGTPTAGLVAAAALAPCPPGGPTGSPSRSARDGLPSLTLSCLGAGPPVALPRLAGPALVNLWAAWCAPCRREMPVLQTLHALARGRLQVLGVVTDDDRRDALSAARALGVHYPSVLDSRGTLRRSLGFTGPPITLVVDREGRIAARIVGPVPALPALAAVIRREVGVAL